MTGSLSDSERPTTIKTRVVAHAQQVVRTDAEDRSPLSDALEAELSGGFRGRFDDADVLIISDYGKGVIADRSPRRPSRSPASR